MSDWLTERLDTYHALMARKQAEGNRLLPPHRRRNVVSGVRTIRMVPGRAIDGIADLARDVIGRETFGFFLECEHGWSGVLICSDARSVREVAEQLGRMAIDNCVHCFADTAGESDR